MAEITISSKALVQPQADCSNGGASGKRLVSHLIIWIWRFFSSRPIVWMFFTALKPDQDVFQLPPSLLPYDNLRLTINGQELPIYDVTVDWPDPPSGHAKGSRRSGRLY